MCNPIFRSEEVVVPQVLQAIFNLPADSHIAVYHTSVQLIGELSPWIGKHPQLLGNTSFLQLFNHFTIIYDDRHV